MKIVTWNINGLRSLKTPLKKLLDSFEADIICFQETKISKNDFTEPLTVVEGYNSYFSYSKLKTGYSGVATYVSDKYTPYYAEDGLTGVNDSLLSSSLSSSSSSILSSSAVSNNIDEASTINDRLNQTSCHGDTTNKIKNNQNCIRDTANVLFNIFSTDLLKAIDVEGRCVITEHLVALDDSKELKRIVIFNVYCPRSGDNPERQKFKINFYRVLRQRCEEILKIDRQVIIVGDINTAHKKIDNCDPDIDEIFLKDEGRIWLDSFLLPITSIGPNLQSFQNNQSQISSPVAYTHSPCTNSASAISNHQLIEANFISLINQLKNDKILLSTANEQDYNSLLINNDFSILSNEPFNNNSSLNSTNFAMNNISNNINSNIATNIDSHLLLFVDVTRMIHPHRTNMFTNWCTITGARATNYGQRIDYIFADVYLANTLIEYADILPEIFGSDHCPVYCTMRCEGIPADTFPKLCTRNIFTASGKQEKIFKYFMKKGKSNSKSKVLNDLNEDDLLKTENCFDGFGEIKSNIYTDLYYKSVSQSINLDTNKLLGKNVAALNNQKVLTSDLSTDKVYLKQTLKKSPNQQKTKKSSLKTTRKMSIIKTKGNIKSQSQLTNYLTKSEPVNLLTISSQHILSSINKTNYYDSCNYLFENTSRIINETQNNTASPNNIDLLDSVSQYYSENKSAMNSMLEKSYKLKPSHLEVDCYLNNCIDQELFMSSSVSKDSYYYNDLHNDLPCINNNFNCKAIHSVNNSCVDKGDIHLSQNELMYETFKFIDNQKINLNKNDLDLNDAICKDDEIPSSQMSVNFAAFNSNEFDLNEHVNEHTVLSNENNKILDINDAIDDADEIPSSQMSIKYSTFSSNEIDANKLDNDCSNDHTVFSNQNDQILDLNDAIDDDGDELPSSQNSIKYKTFNLNEFYLKNVSNDCLIDPTVLINQKDQIIKLNVGDGNDDDDASKYKSLLTLKINNLINCNNCHSWINNKCTTTDEFSNSNNVLTCKCGISDHLISDNNLILHNYSSADRLINGDNLITHHSSNFDEPTKINNLKMDTYITGQLKDNIAMSSDQLENNLNNSLINASNSNTIQSIKNYTRLKSPIFKHAKKNVKTHNAQINADNTKCASLWSKLLKGQSCPPNCPSHKEACVRRVVKKGGPNQGKAFWTCARPEGHKNNKEARCNFFLWCN